MKKILKLFLLCAVILTVAAMAVMAVSADGAARRYDPTTLVPTGERVIFIKDAPKGETLKGDGSGIDADNPFIPMDHEDFDPGADAPMNHLQTAFYQATELLAEDGGTIVICGPVHFGINESHGSGDTTKDVFTATWGSKRVIKFTSVYGGVDYRETAGAKITIETPAEIGVLGASIWENLDIETDGTERVISFGSHPTLIGQGVKCYPSDEEMTDVAANYISLSGGHRYARGTDQIPTLTVQSGTYNKIVGGLWGVLTNKGMENATSYLTLEGTTRVLGFVSGTVGKNSPYSGFVNITINDGIYECDIYGCGSTGFTNADGTVTVTVNGGDFTKAWSLCGVNPGASNNYPAYSTLDLSGFKGDKAALAAAYAVSVDFTEVKLPEGVTEEEMAEFKPAETEPEETVGATEPTTETKPVQETEKVKDEKDEDKKPEESVGGTDLSPKNDGGNDLILVLIIVIIVAVVVLGGLGVAILITLNKKKSN